MRRHGLENLVVTGSTDYSGRRMGGRHQRLKYLDSLCKSWKDNASITQLIGQKTLASHGRQRHLDNNNNNIHHGGHSKAQLDIH